MTVLAERTRPAPPGDEPALVSSIERIDASVDPLALFASARALGEEPALWSQPGEDLTLLALGAAWTVRASGPSRFRAVDEAWQALCAAALVVGDEEAPRGTGPLLLGGLGFADEPAAGSTWRGFETASLVLPDLLLTTTSDGAWLTVNRAPRAQEALASPAPVLAERWSAVVAGAPGADAARNELVGTLRLAARQPEAAAWRESVARLAGAVGRGRLDKVVLARAVEVVAAAPVDVAAVLARLRAADHASTVFAVQRAVRTFLGASPERLVRVEGRDVRSVAMAGSAPRSGDDARDAGLASELLRSDKEREEHAVVVAMLRQTLAPLAAELEIPAVPYVTALPHVQHLVTPVSAELREPMSVLDLTARLHPTPAVGGAPRGLALELIAEEEHLERGWFAGPLGWVDRHGDGEMIVALRSGVVEGARATLFAGCGIMADSDADREWAESAAKLRSLGSALGGIET